MDEEASCFPRKKSDKRFSIRERTRCKGSRKKEEPHPLQGNRSTREEERVRRTKLSFPKRPEYVSPRKEMLTAPIKREKRGALSVDRHKGRVHEEKTPSAFALKSESWSAIISISIRRHCLFSQKAIHVWKRKRRPLW